MPANTFTFRDRVKIACLVSCVKAGMTEEQMINAFQAATARVRSGALKEANVFGNAKSTLSSLVSLGLIGIAGASLAGAGLGRVSGSTLKNISIGRIPPYDEINKLDEIVAYQQKIDEIKNRIEEDRLNKEKQSKPSNRRTL